jgi:hypothetical protein
MVLNRLVQADAESTHGIRKSRKCVFDFFLNTGRILYAACSTGTQWHLIIHKSICNRAISHVTIEKMTKYMISSRNSRSLNFRFNG